jgi:hypothetical protein
MCARVPHTVRACWRPCGGAERGIPNPGELTPGPDRLAEAQMLLRVLLRAGVKQGAIAAQLGVSEAQRSV